MIDKRARVSRAFLIAIVAAVFLTGCGIRIDHRGYYDMKKHEANIEATALAHQANVEATTIAHEANIKATAQAHTNTTNQVIAVNRQSEETKRVDIRWNTGVRLLLVAGFLAICIALLSMIMQQMRPRSTIVILPPPPTGLPSMDHDLFVNQYSGADGWGVVEPEDELGQRYGHKQLPDGQHSYIRLTRRP